MIPCPKHSFWEKTGVHVAPFDRVMFTVHMGDDMTRWSHRKSFRCPELPHMYVHYPGEYTEVKKTCKKRAAWLYD